MKKLLVLALTIHLIIISISAFAAPTVLTVPSAYPTIQSAIDAAADGDTVMISPGTYTGEGNRDIDFAGKAITVQSTNPEDPNIVEQTIIDCQGSLSNPHRGFNFHSGEDANSILDGITITNGWASVMFETEGPLTIYKYVVGGAIYCELSSPTISRCRIVSNHAECPSTGDGGGFISRPGEINSELDSGNIIGLPKNTEFIAIGGGIYCKQSSAVISDCLIKENHADKPDKERYSTSAYGGGVACVNSNTTLVRCSLLNNFASSEGGGIYCTNSNMIINNCTLSYNSAIGKNGYEHLPNFFLEGETAKGGGIFCNSLSSINLENSTILGNTAIGGIGGTPRCFGCVAASGGRAYGGGIACEGTSQLNISNCILSLNRVSGGKGGSAGGAGGYGYGGGITCDGESLVNINNSIFSHNIAHGGLDSTPDGISYGGNICNFSNNTNVTNSVIIDGTSDLGPQIASIKASGAGSSYMAISYCNIKGSQSLTYKDAGSIIDWGAGNIDVDPQFVSPPFLNTNGNTLPYDDFWVEGDYHLMASSPCINAGDPNFTAYPGQTDIDGDARIADGRIDIGPDEFLDSDFDGLPDFWELKYFGSPTASNPQDDPDGDYLTNLKEYNGGTNPIIAPTSYFVNSSVGSNSYDGLSPAWDGVHGPKTTIQAAINAANSGKDEQVVIAPGVYKGNGNRDLDYFGKAIMVRSTNPADSNVVANTIIDCNGSSATHHRGIYFHSNEQEKSILDGVTIINGYSDFGGGIECLDSSPTIINCIIKNNTAVYRGGGINISSQSKDIEIRNCEISGNEVLSAVGNLGGGIYLNVSSGKITNCSIRENISGNNSENYVVYGGGICFNAEKNAEISNCLVSENLIKGYESFGGGIYLKATSGKVSNCIITKNRGGDEISRLYPDGGGIYLYADEAEVSNSIIAENLISSNDYLDFVGCGISLRSTSSVIKNCTIVNNRIISNWHERTGGGIYSDRNNNYPVVTNCILWNNSDEQIYLEPDLGQNPVTYSNIQGGLPGTGNIDKDPLFAFDDDYHIIPGSPCIDAGDPNFIPASNETDLDGNSRLSGDSVDMGAYEYNSLNPPRFGISEVSFSFLKYPGKPLRKQLPIRNTGGEPLNWQIVEDCNWLNFSSTRGTSTGQINDITLSVNTDGLTPGDYSSKVIITDPNAVNNPVVIDVTLHIGSVLNVPLDFPTIQAAVDAATDWDTVSIADGIYSGEGDRDIDFLGKMITVKSVNGPNDCIIDCNGSSSNYHRGFYFHNSEDANSIIEGITIVNGYHGGGGAIYSEDANPTVAKCIFADNYAVTGGAIHLEPSRYNIGPLKIEITDCLFINNSSKYEGGAICISNFSANIYNCSFIGNFCVTKRSRNSNGGAIYNYKNLVSIENCIFSDNYSVFGGAIYNYEGEVDIANSLFNNNHADYDGGCISNIHTIFNLKNCQFSNNSTTRDGGAISHGGPDFTATNCLFSDNSAARGGAVVCPTGTPVFNNCTFVGNQAKGIGNITPLGGAIYNYNNSDSIITNSILYDNRPEQISGSCSVTFTNIQGDANGVGNIDADPCFVVAGYWDANGSPNEPNDDYWVEGDCRLELSSPCFNAGDPNYVPLHGATDLGGNARVIGGRVDMGAYETLIPPLECLMKFTPQTLNTSSKGKWVKGHITLPEGYSPNDVDTNTPAFAVIGDTEIVSDHINVFVNDSNQVEIEISFARSSFSSLPFFGPIEIMVTGDLLSGRLYYGTDTILLLNKTKDRVTALTDCWLNESCANPDWCGGGDLNFDGAVNFLDMAILNNSP